MNLFDMKEQWKRFRILFSFIENKLYCPGWSPLYGLVKWVHGALRTKLFDSDICFTSQILSKYKKKNSKRFHIIVMKTSRFPFLYFLDTICYRLGRYIYLRVWWEMGFNYVIYSKFTYSLIMTLLGYGLTISFTSNSSWVKI